MTNEELETKYYVNILFGYVKLYSWFEPDSDGNMIGMGRKIVYDENRRVVEDTTTPTGCKLIFN